MRTPPQRGSRVGAYLECVDDRLDVRFDGLVGELGAGQRAHALQGQVAQVGLPVLQELAQLVTGTHQQVGLTGIRERGRERERIKIPCITGKEKSEDNTFIYNALRMWNRLTLWKHKYLNSQPE